MSIRTCAFTGGVILAAAIAGVATSQQRPPSPTAATQVGLTPSRADAAALAQARQDPLTARLRALIARNKDLAEVQGQADASSVPVLAPPDAALLGTASLFTGDRHYMLVVERDGQIIEIYGAAKAFQSPLAEPAPKPVDRPTPVAAAARPTPTAGAAGRGPRMLAARVPDAAASALAQARENGLTDVRTERTEYGVDVTFSRFGAAYNVSFICEAPGAGGCSEPEAVAFAAGLQLIGGGGS